MSYLSTIFFMVFISSIAYADVCTHVLLVSSSWKHMKSGDVYVLETRGKMKCRNEKRHRGECDYVYTSDFIGIPKTWKLIDENLIDITFDTGVFKSETVQFPCSFRPVKNELAIGEVVFIQTHLPAKD